MKNLYKLFNLLVLILLAFGAICWGIWGICKVEIIPLFFGQSAAQALYGILGVCGLYGVHLFIDYAKKEWCKH